MVHVLIDSNFFDPRPLIADMPECLSIRSHTTRSSVCQHLAAIMRIVLTAKTVMCFPDHFAVRIKLFVSVSRLCFSFRGVFQSLVSKHFPSEKQRREKAPGNKRKRKWRGYRCHTMPPNTIRTVPILCLSLLLYVPVLSWHARLLPCSLS